MHGSAADRDFVGRQWQEIANRMGTILGEVDVLAEGGSTPHEIDLRDHAVALLQADTQRLRKVIDQLQLAWALSSGTVKLRTEATQLVPLIEASVSRAGGVAPVSMDIPDFWLVTDKARLGGALIELIDNAVMHGGGAYRVEAETYGHELILRVVDSGEGVSTADAPRVCDPWFKRPGSSGAGLGLWLARAQIQFMGGEFGFDSAPGQGVTATLRVHSHSD